MKRAAPTSSIPYREKRTDRVGAPEVLYQNSTLGWILKRSLEAVWLLATAAFSLAGVFGFYGWITGSGFTGRAPAWTLILGLVGSLVMGWWAWELLLDLGPLRKGRGTLTGVSRFRHSVGKSGRSERSCCLEIGHERWLLPESAIKTFAVGQQVEIHYTRRTRDVRKVLAGQAPIDRRGRSPDHRAESRSNQSCHRH